MNLADRIRRAKTDMDEVYEAGKTAQYNAFWDAFQRTGARTSYYSSFISFNRDAFFPKYDIKMWGVTGAFSTFRTFPESCAADPPSESFDLAKRLNECGVKLDTSKATQATQTFYYSSVSHIPVLDLSSVESMMTEVFYYCKRLHTIDKIILSSNGRQTFDKVFGECSSLKNVTFEGVIGNNISFQWCTLLSKASIENIVSVLSADATGKTLSLSKNAVDSAFSSEEWTALADTRTNWTISLV